MKCLSISIKSDITKVDALALQAETEQDFSILHMSNSLKELAQVKRRTKCWNWRKREQS